MITVRLKQADYEAMIAHAKSGLPNEACGLIAGKAEGEVKTVEKVYFLPNPDSSPEHFSISPREQLAALKDMRASGLAPLGNFHSHPSTPARLSEEDLRFACDSKASYLVLTLAGDAPALKAFGVVGGVVSEQGVEVG